MINLKPSFHLNYSGHSKNKLKFKKSSFPEMKFGELERKIEGLLPNMSAESQMLLDLFMPFCRELQEKNDPLRKENKKLRNQWEQNSRNSSKPPSQDVNHPVKRRTVEGVSKCPVGGQPGYKSLSWQLKDNPDYIVQYKLGDCPEYGHDWRQVKVEDVVQKKVEDIYRGRRMQAHVGMEFLPGFSGIEHQDVYRPYDDYAKKRNSLCCGQIVRKLEFTIERDGQCSWALPMKDLLLGMNKVQAKVSGWFRDLEPAQKFMCIRTLVGTVIKQAVYPLQTLESVFTQGNSGYMKLIYPE